MPGMSPIPSPEPVDGIAEPDGMAIPEGIADPDGIAIPDGIALPEGIVIEPGLPLLGIVMLGDALGMSMPPIAEPPAAVLLSAQVAPMSMLSPVPVDIAAMSEVPVPAPIAGIGVADGLIPGMSAIAPVAAPPASATCLSAGTLPCGPCPTAEMTATAMTTTATRAHSPVVSLRTEPSRIRTCASRYPWVQRDAAEP
jgi:hypothetical protein